MVLLPISLLPALCGAQDSTWVLVSNSTAQCEWLLPQPPTILDTLNVEMYALSVDSTLGVTVHVIENAMPDTASLSLFGQALAVEGDTLRAMAHVMITASAARLLAISDTTIQTVPVLDFAIGHPTDGLGKEEVSFLRLIYRDRKFLCFAVSAPEERTGDAHSLRIAVWNSIVLL